jgi:uncharacterized LabA/DUF88 family protein
MIDDTYVYVDGESHFIRSRAALKKSKGEELELSEIAGWEAKSAHNSPGRINPLHADSNSKVFWAEELMTYFCSPRWVAEHVSPRVYFTSFAGDAKGIHELKVLIRSFHFEPVVIEERSQLAKQRQNLLENNGILERAKGVDIEMAVRILEDAYQDSFRQCILFCSDVDYLPVIKAIQRKGKRIILAGYTEGMSEQSPLFHVPDEFWNLSKWMNVTRKSN